MKYTLLVLLALGISPLVFAATDTCDMNCCLNSGGSWDSDYGMCSDQGDSYYSCINQCEGSAGFNASCCGSAFILASVGFGAFLARRG